MTPDEVSVYEDGQVKLKVCTFYDPLRTSYWLCAGAAALEFTEDTILNLETVISAFYYDGYPPPKNIWKYLFFLVLTTAAVLFLVALRGGLL